MKERYLEVSPEAEKKQEEWFSIWLKGEGIPFVDEKGERAYRERVILMKEAIQLKQRPGRIPVCPSAGFYPMQYTQGEWGAFGQRRLQSGGMSSGAPGAPYHGFATGTPACQFTGTSESYIEIPPQSLLTDSWTLTCWAKRNGISEYWNMLYSNPTDLGQPVAGPSHPVTGVGFGNGGNPSGVNNDLRMYWVGVDGNTGRYGATPNPQLYMPDQQDVPGDGGITQQYCALHEWPVRHLYALDAVWRPRFWRRRIVHWEEAEV